MVQSCIQFGLSLGPRLGAVVAADGGERIAFGRAFLVAAALCGAAGAGMLLLRAWTRSTAAVGVVAPPDDAGP
jgi:hypothetical protein